MNATYKGLHGHDSLWLNYAPNAFGRFGTYREGFALPIENEFAINMQQKLIVLDTGITFHYDYVISLDGQVVEYFVTIDYYELPFNSRGVVVYKNGLLSVDIRTWENAGGKIFIIEPELFLIIEGRHK